ncbi:MAG: hypothetical protein AAFQ68_00830 [Bacteroidota bacterium]
MRNRKYNKVLLPLVLLVWGLIGFRFWSGEEKLPTRKTITTSDIVETTESDSFSLSLPFRDPFLNRQAKGDKRSPKERDPKSAQVLEEKVPQIAYKGVIEAKERMGLLVWEGKSKMVVRDQRIRNARISRIEFDFIEINIAGKVYRIGRGKSIGTV